MELLELAHISEDAIVRIKQGTPPLVSVIDIIKVMTGKNANHSAEVLRRISATLPDVTAKCVNFQFPGQGQRPTPVADLDTILMILQHLPGASAQKYREKTAETLRRYLTGDQTMHADIDRNATESNPFSPFRCMNNSFEQDKVEYEYQLLRQYQQKVYESNLELTMRNNRIISEFVLDKEKEIESRKLDIKMKGAQEIAKLELELEKKNIRNKILQADIEAFDLRRDQDAKKREERMMKVHHDNDLQKMLTDRVELKLKRKSMKEEEKQNKRPYTSRKRREFELSSK